MDILTPITREEMLLNDEPLTPITREEKILTGEDLNPVTRREYFLKKYRHAGGDVMVEGLSVTANGTYTAPEGKAYSPVEVAVPLPENAYLLKEASGSLVSFPDGADLPMPSFVCNIEPVQDLHGYDAPWVGGAGKNKARTYSFNVTAARVTFAYGDNGVTLSGTASQDTGVPYSSSASAFTFHLNAGTYTVSITPAKEGVVPQIINQSTGNVVSIRPTFTISKDMDVYYRVAVTSGTVSDGTYKIQLESGSTATEFTPYSNICPISGHTGVNAVVSPTTEASAGTTYSVSWQNEAGEVFDGYVDLVSGVLTVTDGYIASYNGETLPSTWISDRDVYAEGTTPTTGAEVVYKLASTQTYQLTPTQIKSLVDDITNAWCDTGDVDIDYFAKEV